MLAVLKEKYAEVKAFYNLVKAKIDQDLEAQSVEGTLIALVSIGVTLLIALAVLGALTPTMQSLVTNTSFAGAADAVTSNLSSAFNIAAIVPLVVIAAIIIAIIQRIRT